MNEISHASWCANHRSTLDVDGLFHECRSTPIRLLDADRQSLHIALSRRTDAPALVTLEEFRLSPTQARGLAAELMSAAEEAEAG